MDPLISPTECWDENQAMCFQLLSWCQLAAALVRGQTIHFSGIDLWMGPKKALVPCHAAAKGRHSDSRQPAAQDWASALFNEDRGFNGAGSVTMPNEQG